MEELFDQFGWKITLETAPLPDGRMKKAALAQRADTVHILAFKTPGTVLLLREFRPFYGQHVWMLPSGKADKETDMQVAAQRELREETGFEAAVLVLYGECRYSEGLKSISYLFTAHDLTSNPLPQDPEELIEVHELSLSDAVDRVLSSPIVHSTSAYFLLRYARENGL